VNPCHVDDKGSTEKDLLGGFRSGRYGGMYEDSGGIGIVLAFNCVFGIV
jgi:hypothetical protein